MKRDTELERMADTLIGDWIDHDQPTDCTPSSTASTMSNFVFGCDDARDQFSTLSNDAQARSIEEGLGKFFATDPPRSPER
jgi:hypothetical protein